MNSSSTFMDNDHGPFLDPRPPNMQNKRSLTNKHNKEKLNNQKGYSIAHPPLLTELDAFLKQNLALIDDRDDVTSSDWLSMKRLKIYREAFARFIEEFNIYKPFLLTVKHEYESALDFISNEARVVLPMKTELVAKERDFHQKLLQKDQICTDQILTIKTEKETLQKQLEAKDKELRYYKAQIDILKATNERVQSETLDVKSSCVTLTNALTRIEDEKKKISGKDSSRLGEMTTLKVALQKANNDIDRWVVKI